MSIGLAIMLWAAGAATVAPGPQPPCAEEVHAAATAHRLAELPADVRAGLAPFREIFGDELADSDAPLLRTDAPTAAERDHPTMRFAQALLIGDKWFVQFEVSQFAGVRTVAFTRQADGRFRLSPSHHFGGPACASIKAALSGVYTPGGF